MNKFEHILGLVDWSNVLRSQTADVAFELFLKVFMITVQQRHTLHNPRTTGYRNTPRQPCVTKSRKDRLFLEYKCINIKALKPA